MCFVAFDSFSSLVGHIPNMAIQCMWVYDCVAYVQPIQGLKNWRGNSSSQARKREVGQVVAYVCYILCQVDMDQELMLKVRSWA